MRHKSSLCALLLLLPACAAFAGQTVQVTPHRKPPASGLKIVDATDASVSNQKQQLERLADGFIDSLILPAKTIGIPEDACDDNRKCNKAIENACSALEDIFGGDNDVTLVNFDSVNKKCSGRCRDSGTVNVTCVND